jgi:Predicted nucleotide-binding protein containing TIR-like domain
MADIKNIKPRIFIASSSERLDVAYEIQTHLQRDADCTVWDQNVFIASDNGLDNLLSVPSNNDFGIFIFINDDISRIRGNELNSVRDNVIFELGLFMGALGRKRCFIVKPQNQDIYIPSDLDGFNFITYVSEKDRSDQNLSAALSPATNKIRNIINQWKNEKKNSYELYCIDKDQCKTVISNIAHKFIEEPQTYEIQGRRLYGWGQYFGVKKIGFYGTLAGATIISISNRRDDFPSIMQDVFSVIKHWWEDRKNNEYGTIKFSQTLRMADFLLSLKLINSPDLVDLQSDVESTLKEGVIRGRSMWGDSWQSSPPSKLFPSCIALLSLTLAEENLSNSTEREFICSVAREIVSKVLKSADQNRHVPKRDLSAATAAVTSARCENIDPKFMEYIESRIYEFDDISINDQKIYSYDYEWTHTDSNKKHHNTDYYHIPPCIFLAIAGLYSNSSSKLKAFSSIVLRNLISNHLQDGLFIPDDDNNKISTKAQVWLCLLLRLAALVS